MLVTLSPGRISFGMEIEHFEDLAACGTGLSLHNDILKPVPQTERLFSLQTPRRRKAQMMR